MSKPGLLIVDDQEEIRSQLRWALDDTYDVHPVGNAREALAYMKRERPPLVTLDLGLPPRPDDAVEGLALLEGLLAIDRLTKVVVLTGNNERSSALRAIQSGAFDYIQKPVHLETLRVTLGRAAYVHQLEQENRRLQQQATQDGFQGIIGTSSQMQHLFETVRRVASSDLAVLIVGESGTGKELVARAVHRESPRRDGRSSPSTAAPFRKICLKANFSATKRAPLPARTCNAKDGLKVRKEARSFWMKSANCLSHYKSSCYDFCKNKKSSVWGGASRSRWTPVLWLRRT